jgi:hypothetical protein
MSIVDWNVVTRRMPVIKYHSYDEYCIVHNVSKFKRREMV